MVMNTFGQVIPRGFDHSPVQQARVGVVACEQSIKAAGKVRIDDILAPAKNTKNLCKSTKSTAFSATLRNKAESRDEMSFAQFMGCSKVIVSSNLELSDRTFFGFIKRLQSTPVNVKA